jgi:peptidoglycan/xylan/chitin deacetylase (PgdA/CDA1 family)
VKILSRKVRFLLRKIILFLLLFLLPTHVFGEQRVPILIYHSIDEFNGVGSKELYVTPINFEKQISYLRDQGFTLLTFERWQDISKVKKPIFITFDDGYKNNLNAYNIFKKLKNEQFKPSGTFFVISEFIGNKNRLSASELRSMANSGIISVQSHTATHPDLTKSDTLEYELKESKEKIEKITGKPVIALAYPYGAFNEQVAVATKKYYRFGLTTTPELFIQKNIKNELYYLPRIYVKYSTTLEDFSRAVSK